MKFTVATIRLPGHDHSHAFDEVGETVVWGLNQLGNDAALGDFSGDDIKHRSLLFGDLHRTILFGAHLHNPDIHPPLPEDCIIYNLEHSTVSWVQALASKFSGFHIWDYSKDNVEFWKSNGIKSSFVPISYAPILTRIERKPPNEQDIDVLFYGWLNARRKAVLDKLEKEGLKVVALDHTYGAARDEYISRAKLVLNIHFYMPAIFEIVRCSYLWANGVPVVSEISADDWMYRDILRSTDYNQLVGACLHVAKDETYRKALADRAFNHFSGNSILPVLQNALSELGTP